MAMTKTHPPKGLTKWFLKAPLWLYRNGLGWMMGERFLMFTHVGRKTGQLHQTVVEVVYHDETSDRYYIASGWGEKAHWLKNIAENPGIEVVVGRRRMDAVACRVEPAKGTQALLKYAERYPYAFRKLSKAMMGVELTPDQAGVLRMIEHVPMVAIDPTPA